MQYRTTGKSLILPVAALLWVTAEGIELFETGSQNLRNGLGFYN